MAKVEGQETRFFQKTGFLRHRNTQGECWTDSLVQSNVDVYVLGQVMTTNPKDEYLAKIRAVCDGSREDEELYEAIEKFCQQTDKEGRDRTLVPLLKKIQNLRGLTKPSEYHPDSQDILHDTWEQFFRKFPDEFEPAGRSLKGSLLTWINEKLRLRYRVNGLFAKPRTYNKKGEPLTAKQEFSQAVRSKPESLDVPFGSDDGDRNLTMVDLLSGQELEPMQEAILEEQKQNIAMFFKIAEDPKNHVHSCPECTFKAVYERHIFADPRKTLKQIALEFGVNYSSLRSFWNRSCKTIRSETPPELKQALKEYLEDK